jgi:hypothetical protein
MVEVAGRLCWPLKLWTRQLSAAHSLLSCTATACLPVRADKMLPAEERGVRRSIAFSELLQHPNLVRLMGTWESDEFIFVGE